MHEEVFAKIDSESIKGYAVWEPILGTDDARGARKATTILPDPRVRHFWAEGLEIGEAFQPLLGLKGTPAWDVYLVYPAGVEWKENGPPKPAYFMHQLYQLPSSRRLNAENLATRIRNLMATSRRERE